jgi:SAM-dependent methyltransferase
LRSPLGRARPRTPRLLSLGCGAGGIELGFASAVPSAEIVGLDINEELLELGRHEAASRGLNVTFETADLNVVQLEPRSFDVVWCHASLHHLVELEHVCDQIGRSLRQGGDLIVRDVCTPNGYGLWPETRPIVRALFAALPERLRLNHTGYAEPRVDDELWEADTSASGMECIRSEEIIDVLDASFERVAYVPVLSIARRFLDTMYGPNYDLDAPLDRALVDAIWELDCHYIARGVLRPDTFFGVYRPR